MQLARKLPLSVLEWKQGFGADPQTGSGAAAPFTAPPPETKNTITLSFFDRFGPKLDLRMGHRDAMLPVRYSAVRGAAVPSPAAPSPAAPLSKKHPFNNL